MKKNHFASAAAICAGLIFSACESGLNECTTNNNDIIAGATEAAATRTCIDENPESAGGSVGLLWTSGDELGVFASKDGNQVQYTKMTDAKEAEAVFTTTATDFTPLYAYYPYNSANEGRPVTSLYGTLPSTQEMTSGNISGDYKYGRAKEGSAESGYKFVFQHFFSIVNVSIDATGTVLADDVLKTVTLSVKRGETDVKLCGNFFFNVLNGEWSLNGNGSTSLTMDWGEGASLASKIDRYISVFPEIKAGDILNFAFKTEKHTATLSVTCLVDFKKEQLYSFPLTLSNFADKIVIDGGKTDPEPEPEPEVITGTFTCATYNVDGLPSIVNSGGPGSSGTKTLGGKANTSGWDFFWVSEDFEYHSELSSALTNYNAGKYRGSVGVGQVFGSKADTDGLCFFWKKTGLTVSGEKFIEYNSAYGDLYNGANTCIKKGFRYYLVTLEDGTQIDVYITHMNTYSDKNESSYLAAQHAQLSQVAEYIKTQYAQALKNGTPVRPIIFMGDTNMRYTRHKVKELLIDVLNSVDGLKIRDPWIEYPRKGEYPTYGSKSIMAYGTTDTEHDDCGPDGKGYGYQKGEVVDKIFYINLRDAATQIQANSYLCDTTFRDSNTDKSLADHYPVVINFSYTTTKTTGK